jgi:hypothetical protein
MNTFIPLLRDKAFSMRILIEILFQICIIFSIFTLIYLSTKISILLTILFFLFIPFLLLLSLTIHWIIWHSYDFEHGNYLPRYDKIL